ncbi:TPA: N-acetylmuramoyl-L-alanine amidase [Streptococcus suis]
MKFDQKQRFSIRKYSFGAASVLLATVSFMAAQTASAEEVPVSSDVSPVITPSTSTVATAPSVDSIAATETTVTTEATAEAVTQPTDTTGTTSLRSMPQSGSTQAVSNQASQTTPTVASTEPVAPNVAPSGSYVFTQATGVKSEPKISSPDLARYEKGQTVNYDSVVTADQHKWLSYISYGGNRRYVSVGTVAPTTPVNTPVQPSASTTSVSGGSASQGQYNVFNKVVYLDAGHGGSDPGAVYFGKNEKDLNLQIQNRVKSKLEAQGFRVELTRTADSSVGLLPRSEKANRTSSDIFVSIHFNASTSPSANGIETYYYQYFPEYPARINSQYHNDAQRINLSASLANSIQSNLITNTGARNGGVMRRTFQVLRETTAPAVLLELGYMSNSAESAKISSAAYQEKLVDGIVKGISDYYKKHAGLPATTPAPKPAEASKPATTPAVAKPAETPKATVIAGKVSASVTNTATGFNVALSNVPSTVSSVVVPVWSANGGQDDMKVYRANRQSNGQYTFAVATKDHKNDTGTYNMIVYGQNVQTRKLDTLLSGSHNYSATSQSSTAPAVSKPAEASKPVSTPTVAKPAETSKPATTPAVAKPAETPKATVIAGKVSASVTNTATGFNVALSNVPSTVSSVVVPVWSANGGQDDMKVYRASRQTNGQYTFAVATKDHKNDTGTYNMIVYGQNVQTRKLDTLLSGSHNYSATSQSSTAPAVSKPAEASKPVSTPTVAKPVETSKPATTPAVTKPAETPKATVIAGKVSASVTNTATGFNVVLSNVPSTVSSVVVPVWSANGGQDDMKVYRASRQSNGQYTFAVATKDHKNDTGTYNMIVYGQNSQTRKLDTLLTTKHDVKSTTSQASQPAKPSQPSTPATTPVITTPQTTTTARSKTIFIDPGHGGRDSGASYGGVYEKNLVMSVANKLKNNLLQMGYNVLMSRTGDAYVDFVTERSRRANQSNADLFVSLHFNATGAGITNASGIETYWYQAYPEYQPKINQAKHNDPTRLAESQVLANKVQANLVRETGAVNRGVKRNTFAVLRETAIPAVLVEMGFMDNPTELQKIKQDSYHVRLAKALAQGINEWYGAVGGK